MEGLIKIEFPSGMVLTRPHGTAHQVFDPIRKVWLLMTGEEWVRQNFVQFLIASGYPPSLIAIEKKIILNDLTKRCDIVVYSRDMTPFMIIECKQMDVPLSQKVLDQALRYHITLQTAYLVITNGAYTAGYQKINGQFVPIEIFPEYK